MSKECYVTGCSGESSALNLCNKHYQRKRKYGDPEYVTELMRRKDSGETKCSVAQCGRKIHAKALCYRHYMRFYRKGTTDGRDKISYDSDLCAVDDCGRPRGFREYCTAHGTRVHRNGSVGDTPIRNPGEYTWTRQENGYVTRHARIDGKSVTILQHREVMEILLGRALLREETVHHKNGVRWDNRPENLELWSKCQPAGQRVEDKVAWAKELLALYDPDSLR